MRYIQVTLVEDTEPIADTRVLISQRTPSEDKKPEIEWAFSSIARMLYGDNVTVKIMVVK